MGRMVYLPTWMVGVFDGKSRYIYLYIYIHAIHMDPMGMTVLSLAELFLFAVFFPLAPLGVPKKSSWNLKKNLEVLVSSMFVYVLWHFYYVRVHHQKWSKHQMVAVSRLPGMSHRFFLFFFLEGPGRYREKTRIGHHFFWTKDLRQLHRRYIFCEEMLD